MTFHALVDYYNHVSDTLRGVLGTPGHRETVSRIVDAVLGAKKALAIPSTDIYLRLYGGWFDESGDATDDRLQLGAILRDLPRRYGRTRLVPSLADSVLARSADVLHSTRRSRRGLVHFRIDSANTCQANLSDRDCGIWALDMWRRGRCPRHPSCGMRTDNLATGMQQKLVDAMLVADQIYLSQADVGATVATVSNDDDVIPGLLTSRALGARATLVRINRRARCAYDGIMQTAGVQLFDFSE